MTAILTSLTRDPALWVTPVVVFAITLAICFVLRRIFFAVLHSWSGRAHMRAGDILIEALRSPSVIWAVILGVHFAIESSKLPRGVTDEAPKVLQVLFIVSLTLMFMGIAGELVRFYGTRVSGALPVTTLTQNIAQLVVLIVGILQALRAMGLEITPILTALGVGGLAVALALQDTLSNLFSGFYVAVAGQVRLGDYIKLNTGEEGYITDIGWRCTVMRALNNNMIIVPNLKLAQAIVTNYYLPEKRLSSSLQVNVAYGSDLEHVEQVLLEIAKAGAGEIAGMLAEPAPSVVFEPGFGDFFLGLTVNFHVAEFSNQGGVRHELRKRIFRRFKEEGIEIPFPTRTVYMQNPGNEAAGRQP